MQYKLRSTVPLRSGCPGTRDGAHEAVTLCGSGGRSAVAVSRVIELIHLVEQDEDGKRGKRYDNGAMTSAETSVERELIKAAPLGRPVRRGDPDHDDVTAGHRWTRGRTLRADLLAKLLAEPKATTPPRAVTLVGVRVVGGLNLEGIELRAPLIAHRCFFDQPVNLTQATAPRLSFTACHLPGLAGDQLEVRGNLALARSMLEIASLRFAKVGGELNLRGTTLSGGTLPFDLKDATLLPPDTFIDSVRAGVALAASGLTVEHDMLCSDGFSAQGLVDLLAANVKGVLWFTQATLANPGQTALLADGLILGLSLVGRSGFTVRGEARLAGAHIGGQLLLGEATLINPQQTAFYADGLTVDHDLVCDHGFRAEGTLVLSGACVKGRVSLSGAQMANPGPHGSLFAENLTVDRNMDCALSRIEGRVNLTRARIGGRLQFTFATLRGSGNALELTAARIGDVMLDFRERPSGALDLSRAQLGGLIDGAEPSWPDSLQLDNCTYTRLIATADDPVRERIGWGSGRRWWAVGRRSSPKRPGWLERAPFRPQPYEQLGAFYRRQGRDSDARLVAIARERRRRGELSPAGKAWNLFLQWTVGYGYRPWLAGLWLLALLVVGTFVFADAHPDHFVAAKNPPSPFQPFIFTLDLLVPVINLRQRESWNPVGPAEWWALAYTVFGWVLTTAVVAGLTAAVRRN